jgi:hypothetical protein
MQEAVPATAPRSRRRRCAGMLPRRSVNLALVIGLCVGAVYVAVAAFVIVCDRAPHRGGWISLNGILSLLVTLPIAWLAAKCGRPLDPRRTADLVVGVLGTALLVAGGVAALAWPFTAA